MKEFTTPFLHNFEFNFLSWMVTMPVHMPSACRELNGNYTLPQITTALLDRLSNHSSGGPVHIYIL